ncbi:MAG: TIGR03619 family F420-dependent LLM class oxidoreductase [Solirubrobacteraceae bacterium]|nr:TIGR03619 family F420-dependent LLM class oxidoreductase [Patulibacter sp.]
MTDRSVRPDVAARLAEERGFESLFVTEHTHIPASLAEHYPGGSFPDAYTRTLDPIVALTAAAAATTTIRLGTSIMLASQHEPLVTAKALASLDLLSQGRVELGVGAGWLQPELANHGVDYGRRFGHLREHVEAMRTLWRDEVAAYAGEHVRFNDVWSWPKPVQELAPSGRDGDAGGRGIPVLVGGDGARILDRVVAYGDGWLPRAPGGLDELAPRVRDLHGRCADVGRAPLPVTVYNVALDPASLEAYRELGVHRGLVRLPSGEQGEVEAALDAAVAALDAAGFAQAAG